jgi:RNA polymerase sigma factor (sigma-70 family)
VNYSDEAVLEAISKGDDRVLAHLYKNVLPKIKAYVLKNNGSEDDAKDIFQDSVLVFYKYVKQGKFSPENEIAGFIFSVSRNLWINQAKKKNRVVELSESTPMQEFTKSFADELISREREEFVVNMFSKLGETCKQILLYSIYDKFSMKEIKEKMNFTSENVAKTKNYKCKQRLISLVKENASVENILRG